MSRLLLKVVLVLMLAWAAWWWAATTGLQRSLKAWGTERQAAGWQADVEDMTRGGFPFRIASTLDQVALSDPHTGVAVNIPKMTLSSPIYWPGHATVTFPAKPVVLSTAQGAVTLNSAGATAGLRLRPGTALQLEAMTARTSALTVDVAQGRLASLAELQADVQQEAAPATYTLRLDATGLAPGALLRDALRLPPLWPDAFEVFTADMTVRFDRPWDRTAIEISRPQPRAITLRTTEARWGDLSLKLSADLTVDDQGVISGSLIAKADNWQTMLDLAEQSGALPAALRPQLESGLSLLSGMSGNPDTLDLEITIDRGRMQMGFIPLGRAPRIILR